MDFILLSLFRSQFYYSLKQQILKKKEKIIEKTNEKTINEEPKVIKKEINEDKKNKIDVMEEPVLKKINKG